MSLALQRLFVLITCISFHGNVWTLSLRANILSELINGKTNCQVFFFEAALLLFHLRLQFCWLIVEVFCLGKQVLSLFKIKFRISWRMCYQISGKERNSSVNMVLLEEKQNNFIMSSVRLACILPFFLLKSPVACRKSDFHQAVAMFQSVPLQIGLHRRCWVGCWSLR